MLLQLLLSLDASFAKRKIAEKKWEPSKKLSNLIRKTEKENQRINENILAP